VIISATDAQNERQIYFRVENKLIIAFVGFELAIQPPTCKATCSVRPNMPANIRLYIRRGQNVIPCFQGVRIERKNRCRGLGCMETVKQSAIKS